MVDTAFTKSADDEDPNHQTQQNVEGDGSQVIGKMKGPAFNISGEGHSIIITVQPENNISSTNSLKANSANSQIGENPYKGLNAFLEDDCDLFFGRKDQIDDLWNKYSSLHQVNSTTRLLIIHGASGSGKSSLARAGLIAKLKKEPLSGQEQARYMSLVPRNIPLEELAKALAKIDEIGNKSLLAKICEYKDKLFTVNAAGVYDGLRQIANSLSDIDNSPLILLVDQFEELFTACKDRLEQDAFIGNLLHAAEDLSKQVSVIIILRSDFLGKYPQIDRLIQPQGFFVAVMDEAGRKDAITEPAKLAGHPLDLGMINLLIEQTKDREGALPLLQFALAQIWVGLQDGKKPAETLESMGGVGGALAERAQKIYEELEPDQQKIARRVFLGLVQLGDLRDGVKDTRRRMELGRLVSNKVSLEQVREVTTKFAHKNARLITLAKEGDVETAEITHEALFDNWKQFKDWLDGGRSDLRFQRRLDDAVMVWQDHGRLDGNLWRSPNLDLLRDFQKKPESDLTTLQREFLQASINAENVQKQAEERRLQAEIDLAEEKLRTAQRDKDLAEQRLRTAQGDKNLLEQRLRAEKNKKQVRRREFLAFALAIVMVVFIVSSVYLSRENSLLDKKSIELNDQYAYCPREKGRPGINIEGTCFRQLKTSGDVGVFLSSTNFHLDQGIDAFKENNFERAIKLFEQAVDGDRTDPIPLIFLNNAKARRRNKLPLKLAPLKLAVVTSIDYYETAAKNVLRGVANAQDEFNKNQGATDSLLEIVIVNDENNEKAAVKVAEELIKDPEILDIIQVTAL